MDPELLKKGYNLILELLINGPRTPIESIKLFTLAGRSRSKPRYGNFHRFSFFLNWYPFSLIRLEDLNVFQLVLLGFKTD